MPGWFGPASWNARVCAPGDRVPMPVGHLCVHCLERVTPRDGGFVLACGDVLHRECLMRSIVGGVNHILGVCTCCHGILPPDPCGLTVREAAIEAEATWERRLAHDAARARRASGVRG